MNRVFELPDGRRLGYARYGATGGRPLFYFHGWPGSRVEARLMDEYARRSGVQVIAVDRPGYGLSDFQPGRRILDWPEDVLRLADGLGLERFSVVGLSGGGPYAAACAYSLPQRLLNAGIVCGVAPLENRQTTQGMMQPHRFLLSLAEQRPALIGLLARPLAGLIRKWPAIVLRRLLASPIPDADRTALNNPQVGGTLTDTMAEAFRHGSAGALHDGLLYLRPWGLRLDDIAIEVHLWHGELDVNVPVSMGRFLSQRIPRCRAQFLPGHGHFSLPFKLGPEILRTLTPG